MPAHSTHARPRILLVDDDPAAARLTLEALRNETEAPELYVVHSGDAAIQFLRHEGPFARAPRPDLILLDLNLPRINGAEVLRDIKQEPSLRKIPVVVFSTSTAHSDIQQSYNLCANCFVTKPANLDDFLGTVHKLADFWLHTAQLPN